jgi:hypothetical protein
MAHVIAGAGPGGAAVTTRRKGWPQTETASPPRRERHRPAGRAVELDGDAAERHELHAAVGDAEERVVAAHGRVGDHDVAVGGASDEEAAAADEEAAVGAVEPVQRGGGGGHRAPAESSGAGGARQRPVGSLWIPPRGGGSGERVTDVVGHEPGGAGCACRQRPTGAVTHETTSVRPRLARDPPPHGGPDRAGGRVRLPIFSERAEALPDVPSGRDEAARIDLPPYPSGWFGLAFSARAGAGRGQARAASPGREVVVFRTAHGRAAMFDAHCPHLGAHFGHGGCVEGERRCAAPCTTSASRSTAPARRRAPGTRTGPRRRQARCPCARTDGVILAWHHPDGAAPTWEPPRARRPRRWPAAPRSGGRHHAPLARARARARTSSTSATSTRSTASSPPRWTRAHRRPRARHPRALPDDPRDGPMGSFVRRVQVDLVTNVMHGLGVVLFDSVVRARRPRVSRRPHAQPGGPRPGRLPRQRVDQAGRRRPRRGADLPPGSRSAPRKSSWAASSPST